MRHFNRTHSSLAVFGITAFVVFFGLDPLEGVKLVSRFFVSTPTCALIHQRVQKGHPELYKV